METKVVRRVAAVLVVCAAVCIAVVGGSARANAPDQNPASQVSTAGFALPPGVSIKSELVERRTAESSTYLLSNGQKQTVIYASAIHYKDSAGSWQTFDTTLTATVPGSYRTAQTPFTLAIGSEEANLAPVRLTWQGYAVALDMSGLTETSPVVSANRATFLGAGPQTSVSYFATNEGVEQTLSLAAATAPTSFVCTISHPGLVLVRGSDGRWGFYAPGNPDPLFFLEGFSVHDSSIDAAGDSASCPDAAMSVSAGTDKSTLIYTLPKAWLADPSRVFPVVIDPSIDANIHSCADSYVSSGGSQGGTSTELRVGYSASTPNSNGHNRALVKFDLSSIPDHSYINSATLEMYQFYKKTSGSTNTYIGRLNQSWSESSTWSQLTPFQFTALGQQLLGAAPVNLDFGCTQTVQDWKDNVYTNNGFLIYQATDGSQDSGAWYRKFYSREWTTPTSQQPKILISGSNINYMSFSAFSGGPYEIGQTVDAGVTWNCDCAAQTLRIGFGINTRDSDGSNDRGLLWWFKNAPDAGSYDYWSCSGGGYIGVPKGDPLGSYIHINAANCWTNLGSSVRYVDFNFTIQSGYDKPTAEFDAFAAMGPSTTETWNTHWLPSSQNGWVCLNNNVVVTPAPITPNPTPTASADWFKLYDADNNNSPWSTSDGFTPDVLDDSATQGRGSVNLTWSPQPIASGFNILMWDGITVGGVDEYIPVGTAPANATSWSSSGKKIYPTESEISSLAWEQPGQQGAHFSGPFHNDGQGVDLRDSSNYLYRAMGAGVGTTREYRFKVQPCYGNNQTVSEDRCGAAPVTLDWRTVVLANEPYHTTSDLGSWDGHAATAVLDKNSVQIAVNDLSIDSWGPPAELSRVYLSTDSTSHGFAPGWRFSFQQTLTFGAGMIRYTEENGDAHDFEQAGSAWIPPNGWSAGTGSVLAQAGSNWTLTFANRTKLTFDGSGKLLSETDGNGNTTSYGWSGADLQAITAANGQSIMVVMSGGVISSASYATASGTRVVTYTGGGSPSVTYSATSSMVSYTYDGSSHLTGITQNSWPASGSSALEKFVYDGSGHFTEIDYPDQFSTDSAHSVVKADAKVTIAFDTSDPTHPKATLTHYGTINGIANQPTASEIDIYVSVTGTPTDMSIAGDAAPPADGGAVDAQTPDPSGGDGATHATQSYAPNHEPLLTTVKESPGGVDGATRSTTNDSYDVAGNLTSESVTTNQDATHYTTTVTSYNTHGQPTEQTTTDQSAATIDHTTYTYDAADGNLLEKDVDLGAGKTAVTIDTYDTYGRTTSEKDLVTGTKASGTWVETDYSNFASNGEPQTTVHKSVQLAHGGSAQDLTETASYDGFGNLLSQTDTSGSRVVATDTYDLAGRQLTSADAVGTTTHHTYDVLGNDIETWQSNVSTAVKDDWTKYYQGTPSNPSEYGYDAMGRPTTAWRYLHDGSTATLQSKVETTYDGRGKEIWLKDSTVGGLDQNREHWIYDAHGNVTAHWDLGVLDNSDTARATVYTYDGQDRVATETKPGDSAATHYDYDQLGELTKQTNPDGSFTECTYDGEGNKTSETVPLQGYAADHNKVDVTNFVYDEGNRLTSQSDVNKGFTTQFTYDLIDRQLTASGSGQGASSTEYNNLGWVLQGQDADGITTANVYDAAGRLLTKTVGSPPKTTISTYYEDGRLHTLTDPDGKQTIYTYNAFGDKTEEKHTIPGNPDPVTVKYIHTTIDSLGRTTHSHEDLTGADHTWSYPVYTATGTQETLAAGDCSTAVTSNPREQETSRVTTIAPGNTITRSIIDGGLTPGRDAADRWTIATIEGKTFQRSFNAFGKLATQSQTGFTGAGSYTYDPDTGQKSAQSLPLSLGGTLAPTYGYDNVGRLTSSSIGGLTQVSHSAANNLTGFTDAGGSATLTYDSAGRNQLAQMSYGGSTTLFGWDIANGWRTSQGPSSNPNQITYGYTATGRMNSFQVAGAATPLPMPAGYVGEGPLAEAAQGNITVSWPTGSSENQLGLLVISTYGTGGTISVDQGWTLKRSSTNGNARLELWWKRNSGSETAPTITHETTTGNSIVAQIVTFDNVVESGDPWEVFDSGSTSGSDASAELPSLSTLSDGALVFCLTGSADNNDWNTYEAEAPTPPTNYGALAGSRGGDYWSTGLGSDASFAWLYGQTSTAGSIGAPVATQISQGPDAWVAMVGALKPASVSERHNLLANPSFEKDLDSDGAADKWWPGDATSTIVSGRLGGHAQRSQYTGTSSDVNAEIGLPSEGWMNDIAASPGQKLTFSAYAKGSMPHGWSLGIGCLDSNHSWFDGATAYFAASDLTGSWKRYSVTFPSLPAGTAYVVVGSSALSINQNDAVDITFDDALLEGSCSVGAYFDGNSSGASWDGAIDFSPSSLLSSNPARHNLLTNPSLERDSNSDGEADTVLWGYDGSTNPTYSLVAGRTGGSAQRIQETGGSGSTYGQAYIGFDTGTWAPVIPVSPGQPFAASYYAKGSFTGIDYFQIRASFYNSQGNWISDIDGNEPDITSAWQRFSVSGTVPAGATHATLRLEVQGLDPGDTVDLYLDDATWETTSSLGGFFDGDSQGASWDGPANASTSTLAATTGVGLSATYAYDAAGQRRQSVVTDASGLTTTTNYTYDGLSLLSLAADRSDFTSWRIDYLYDENNNLTGGVYRGPKDSTSPTYFTALSTDHNDVVELLDRNGAAFAAYRYDAWGKPIGTGNYATGVWTSETRDNNNNVVVSATLAGQIASRQILRYASYAYDSESGFYCCAARYYDPYTMQWTTGDAAKDDGEESAYQYCSLDPINRIDPSGNWSEDVGGDFKEFQCDIPLNSADAWQYVWNKVLGDDIMGSVFDHGFNTWIVHYRPADKRNLTYWAQKIAETYNYVESACTSVWIKRLTPGGKEFKSEMAKYKTWAQAYIALIIHYQNTFRSIAEQVATAYDNYRYSNRPVPHPSPNAMPTNSTSNHASPPPMSVILRSPVLRALYH